MRKSLLTVVLLVGLAGICSTAQAASPPGPRLAFVRLFEHRAEAVDDSLNLMTTDPGGGAAQLLTGTSRPGGVPPVQGFSWSPDGQTVAIGAVRGQQFFQSLLFNDELDLYLAAADGSGLQQLTNFPDNEGEVSDDAVSPVFSADGKSVFFARVSQDLHSSIWAVGVDGSGLRQLTPDAGGTSLDIPASVSPSGDELAFTRIRCVRWFRGCRSNAVAISTSTGSERLIAKRAMEPAYSPDGTRIAFTGYRHHKPNIENELLPATDLYVLDAVGGTTRRLTRTKGLTEGHPSWDPSGQRIAFSRGSSTGLLGQNLGVSPRILEINADGSCETLLFRKAVKDHSFFGKDFAFPAWQPGPGREAGRIAC
jgi:Tol biopolymer transport system component